MIDVLAHFAPTFLTGFFVNLQIAGGAMLIGLALGGVLALAAFHVRWLGGPIGVLIQLLFCLPGYVVMFFLANMLVGKGMLTVVLAQAVFTTAYCSDIVRQALKDIRAGDRGRASLFIPNAIRGFTVTTMSSGLASAVGIPEAVGVTMREAEHLPAFGDRIMLFLCVTGFFAAFFGCVRLASGKLTARLARQKLRAADGSKGGARRRQARGISLQASIVSYFVTLLLITCGGITWYSYAQNRRLVMQYADQFLTDSSSSTIENTDHLLSPVAAALEEIAVTAQLHPEQLLAPDIQRHLLQVMLSYPSVTGVFIGFEANGNYTQVQRIPLNAASYGPHARPLVPGSRFALRNITHGPDGTADAYRFIAAWDHETGTDHADFVTYDPRRRPFYTGAVRQNGRFLTDIYLFASNGKPGLTISLPLRDATGRLLGAVGADIALENLADFLRRQRIGKTGVAFIVDDQDQIVSYPDAGKNARQTEAGVALMKVDELGIQPISDAFRRRHDDPAPRFTFHSSGEDYLASFQAFPESFGKHWSIAIVVPVNDFVGSLKTNSSRTLLATVLMAFLAIVAADVLARRIARAILGLTQEAQEIRAFRLDGDITVSSRITEIRQLIEAMSAMKSAIFAFSRYVPRGLVQQLLESGRASELGGQNRRLTLMFTDLENFSRISEQMSPRQLMLLVSEHLDVVTRLVLANSGTVDKFIGDSVMAFWGAPLPQDDHAYNACVTALQAQHAMDMMNANPKTPDQPHLTTRIGLHTDSVIVGNIGSSERMSYTALGDGVNVASRLEGVNKFYHTRTVISEAVLQEAGAERLVTRPLDHVAVKGRKGGVTIHELMALRGGDTPVSATEAQERLAAVSARAFVAYRDRDWETAIQFYELIQEMQPGDYPSRLLMQRCRDLLEAAPAEWSGSFEMLDK
jgi:adenylate cyclase